MAKKIPKVTDEPIVEDEVTELNDRWNALQAALKEKQDEIKKLDPKFTKFVDNVSIVDEELARYSTLLDQPLVFGLQVKDGKASVNKIKDILREVERTGRNVDNVKKCGNDLACQLENYDAEPSHVTSRVKDIDERYESIKDDLMTQKEVTEKKIDNLEKFWTDIEEIDKWYSGLTDEVDKFEPVSTDPEKIKEQLAKIEVNDIIY